MKHFRGPAQSIAVSLLFLSAVISIGLGSVNSSTSIIDDAAAVSGTMIIVNSTDDSGPGTLRQGLLDAQSGDTITFDPAVFPPGAPVTISVTSELPHINQGNVTIDASNVGVILDGSSAGGGEWIVGLGISSEGNTIQGLQIENFSGAGIVLNEQAHNNTIGGDRNIGAGLIGRGNLSSGNSDGIGIFGASGNIIVGNLIGTDTTGQNAFGNRNPGIFIEGDASNNVIGPENVIAYNDNFGVDVRGLNAFGNTITRNSIHDNSWAGIHLPEGDDAKRTPIVFDYDLASGTISGITCANCMVEIFSDSDDEGKIFEGETMADGFGVFAFDKGLAFTGPHLTATATDYQGNTSDFSQPTTGVSRSLVIQEGNDLLKTRLDNKHPIEMEDNRIGSQWSGLWQPGLRQPADLQHLLATEIIGVGLKRVRLAINGISWDTVDWDKPEFTIEQTHDEWITDIANNDVTITYVLTFWDKDEEKGVDCPRFRTEKEIQRYLDFVRFIVRHFKDRVRYFELWNEPDIGVCIQRIEVEDYISVAKRVIPAIRQEYPGARIKVGGTMHLRELESHDYFFSIIESDIMPLVDAVAWHLGPSISPEYEYWRDYYYEYPNLVKDIKKTASANGFTGEFIADEQTWWTPDTAPPNETHFGTYSEKVAAKYYARGILTHLGMDVTVGLGGTGSDRPTSSSVVSNLCTAVAGVRPAGLLIEFQSEATNIAHYSFSLSNGDYLIALWTNGVAVDDDPGIPTTLIIPDFAGYTVTGIDVLHGFQQRLVIEETDGNLVIRDLLVKDYPLILRLSPTRNVYLPTVYSLDLK